ncbi:hypothetical protein [Bradyrhizobium sp. CCBAU 51765]|uniref:hypothetical protein n=1 Tax=Bradyrhizobium sp. CCBAU 51765 TaxID=1325102 RepID=UPI001886C652|nr:hypothetical protein [Bradyrhizobium sp. CCBAU 51765]
MQGSPEDVILQRSCAAASSALVAFFDGRPAFAMAAVGGSAHNANKPNANMVTVAEQAIRYFKELHGDSRLGKVTREGPRFL